MQEEWRLAEEAQRQLEEVVDNMTEDEVRAELKRIWGLVGRQIKWEGRAFHIKKDEKRRTASGEIERGAE